MLPGVCPALRFNLASMQAETRQLVYAMTVPPSYERINDIDLTIQVLKLSATWDTLDLLYFLCAHDQQASLLNWKDPFGPYNLTVSGTPTFTANEGWTGNGTDGWLRSGFVPSTAGGNASLNSVHISCIVRTSAGEAVPDVAAHQALLRIDTNRSPNALARANDGTNQTLTPSPATGFFIVNRNAASGAGAKLFRQDGGAVAASASTASTSLASEEFIILGGHSTGGVSPLYSTKQLSFASLGGGFPSDVDADTFYGDVMSYPFT